MLKVVVVDVSAGRKVIVVVDVMVVLTVDVGVGTATVVGFSTKMMVSV